MIDAHFLQMHLKVFLLSYHLKLGNKLLDKEILSGEIIIEVTDLNNIKIRSIIIKISIIEYPFIQWVDEEREG